MKWRQHMEAAVSRIAAALGPRGQWPGWVFPDATPDSGRKDLAPPLSALGILALHDLPVAGVEEVVRRSRQHLELTVLPGGLWRYYANIPPDTDDSAMCALALGLDHTLVRGQTAASLRATRLADGRFPTWFEPGWAAAVDCIPNAHVVAVIGAEETTSAAVAWLVEVVASGREVATSLYYRDPLDLHLALTRALFVGVDALRPAIEIAAERARQRLREDHLSPYRRAQAMIVAGASASPLPAEVSDAATRLVESADPDGCWPAETLYVAGNTESAGLWHYQSWAVTTALCVRALASVAPTTSTKRG